MPSAGDLCTCENCGNLIGYYYMGNAGVLAPDNAYISSVAGWNKKYFCTKRCKEEYKAGKSSKGSSESEQTTSSSQEESGRVSSGGGVGGFFGSIVAGNALKKAAEMAMTPEQVRAKAEADAQRRKEVDEADKKFYDSTKKFFGSALSKLAPSKFTDNAQVAKDQHRKLQDLEIDIKLALAKNNVEQALESIKLLKHDSTYFNTPLKIHAANLPIFRHSS